MPAERYYYENCFHLYDSLTITGVEFHHLTHVMRVRKGEHVELVNGKGELATTEVKEIAKDRAILRIEHIFQEPERPCRLILAQAMPKPNRLDTILEKGTELGVDCFWLFPGTLSVKKEMYPQQIERARHITIAAMKQSGRLTLPTIIFQPAISRWSAFQTPAYFGDVDPAAIPLHTFCTKTGSVSFPMIFITGPESGLDPQEMQMLKELGAKGVSLHPNILRTDTASIVAVGLLSHWLFT